VNPFVTWSLGAYLALLLAVSVWSSKRVRDEEDFIVAGRRLPLWLAWGTLMATWFGAATMQGAAQAARDEGLRGTLLDPFASGLALVVAGLFFAGPLWRMRLLTLGDFYDRAFGRRAEVVASLVMVPSYFGWVGVQFLALAGILHLVGGPDERIGIPAVAAVVLVYTLVGGMWSVTLTDTLQLALVLAGLLVLGWTVFGHLGGGSPSGGVERVLAQTDPELLTLLPEAGAAAALAWSATLASGMLGNIPGQDLTQRIFASRDARTAVLACLLAGVVYIAFGLVPVGLGLASRLLVPPGAAAEAGAGGGAAAEGAGKILPVLAGEFLHPALQAVFVITLVSIIVSTATSAILSPATVISHNLLGRIERLRGREVLLGRLAVTLVTAGGVAMAYSSKKILDLLEDSVSITLAALFVPLVAGIYGRPRGELSALFAMALGAAAWAACWGTEAMEDFAGLVGIAASLAGYLAGQAIAGRRDRVAGGAGAAGRAPR
jgi:Na+/proline symporter